MTARACPTFTTARLTLSAHTVLDYEDSLAMWREPQVYRFIGGAPSSPQDGWARILRYAGLWPLVGHGYWVVRETATHRMVGEVGLGEFHRDIAPSFTGTPEAGWVLSPWAHGKGYAREACKAVFAWADDVLRAPRTVCIIDPGNAPSLALAGKLGFSVIAETKFRGEPTVVLERFAATSN